MTTIRDNADERPPLPEGWIFAPLPQILDVQYGKGLTKAERDESGQIPVYGSNGIVGYHTEALIQDPCIIIGRKGAAGEVHYSDKPSWTIDTAYYALPFGDTHPEYLFYYLRSRNLGALDQSTAIPSLSRDDLYALQIPLPPFPEQRRIVEAIESYLTRLDAVVAALERVQRNLARYKASVLQAACEGRLVPTEAELAREQGRDYEHAEVLLPRILAERRARWEVEAWQKHVDRAKKKVAQAERKAAGRPYYFRDIPEEEWQAVPETEYQQYLPKSDKWKQKYQPPEPPDTEDLPALPAGWVWATVEQVIELSQNGFGKRRSKSGIPTIVLRLADIESGEKIDLSDVRRIKLEPGEIDKYRLNKDDLLCIRVNGSPDLVGRFIRFAGADEPIAFCDHFIRFKLAISDLAKFMRFNLNTDRVRKYVEHNKVSSAGQNTVSQATMQSLTIPLPPLAEQRRIVEEVERCLSVVQEVEAAVEANLTRAARLRQSILKRAFEGRLVPQEPDDEPASLLIERIKRS